MKQLKLSILILTIISCNYIAAQNFTAQASKTKVAVGETFQITYTLNTSGGGFKAPNLSDFDIYGGPNQSSNMVFSNGNFSQTISFSYILAPKKEGKLTIGPASINTSSGTVKSNTLTIEAVKGNTQSNQGNAQNNNQNVTPPSSHDLGDNLYIKTIINKSKAYLGEEITVTFKIYTRVDVVQLNVSQMPSCDGFFMQDGKVNEQTTENIDGINYLTAELKKTFLIPLKTGKITIDPIEAECVIRQESKKKSRNIFDQIWGTYENVAVKVKSKPVTVEIMPLPESGKPENFSGAVGSYSMKAELNNNKVKANESINLTIDISGEGNIKLVDPLKISFPDDFEVYDPKITEKIIAGSGGISGSKKFEYLLIPRYPGKYSIENIGFNYFDPEKKQYITIPSPDLIIDVEKGDESSSQNASVYNPKNKEDVKILGTDIRHIKTGNLDLQPQNNYFFGTPAFYLSLSSPLLAFLLFIIVRKKHIENNKDVVLVKSRKANKMALKKLHVAEKHMKANQKDLFYIEISKALYGYLSDKLNLPTSDLTKDNITHLLNKKSVTQNTINHLLDTLNSCEYARYAPNAVSSDLNTIYNNTLELITGIEHEIAINHRHKNLE